MAPQKDKRDNITDPDKKTGTVGNKINELGAKAKRFFVQAGQKIKETFRGLQTDSAKPEKPKQKKIVNQKPAQVKPKARPIQSKPKASPSQAKQPLAPQKPLPKQAPLKAESKAKKPEEKVSEETVVFSDDMTKQFSPTAPKKAPLKKPVQKLTQAQKDETQFIPAVKHQSIFKPREKKPNFVLGVMLTTIKLSFVAIILVVAIGIGSVMGVANAYLGTTPELDVSKISDQNQNTKIYSAIDGSYITTYTGLENRDVASLDEIPDDLKNAVIAVEDIRFYEHNGVDFRRLLGAFVSNLSSSKTEGGSTITQQLVKNTLLTNERSYKRKLQEAYLATELEKKYTKDEILQAYLNAIPLGGTIYGVKTAAHDYFNKELSELNLREMICIAAITQNPTRYNPRTATYTHPEYLPDLINRMNIVAERMYWDGMITEEQYNEVMVPASEYLADESTSDNKVLKEGYLDIWKAEMNVQETSPTNELYPYPHFIEYMMYDVQTFMLEKEGLEDTKANRQKVDNELRVGGYKIYATVDPKIQETVQNTLSEYDGYPTKLPSGVETELTDSAGNVTEQPQSSAVVIDNSTGYLVAIVGSRDDPEVKRSLNRANTGLQVGSSIKPLAVYGPAFDTGYGAASPVANIPVPISGWIVDGEDSSPTITGTQGPVTMRTAIVKSLNVAAARTLMDYVTIDTSVEYLHKLGIPDENITPTGVGLALGGSTVTPIQMTGAYAAIANEGEYRQPVSFTKVLDADNNVVIDTETDRDVHEAFKPSTAYMLTDILEDAVQEGTGSQARLDGMTTAGKTGTVGDNKGVTFAGYTPYYTSMVWVGHDLAKTIGSKAYGGGIAAPLWKEYMQKIHEGLTDKEIIDGTPEDFNINTSVTVCQYSGLKPGSGCVTFTDWMAKGDEPTEVCNQCSSVSVKMCGLSGKRFVEGLCPEEYAYTVGGGRIFPENSPYAQWLGGGSAGLTASEPVMGEGGYYVSGGDPTTDCDGAHIAVPTPTPSEVPSAIPTPTFNPIPTPTPSTAPTHTPDPSPSVAPEG